MELLKEGGCIGEKAFHGEKECFFQPFYSVEKRQIWGAEALFRLKDENGNYYNMDERRKKDGFPRSTGGYSGKPAEEFRSFGPMGLNGSTSTYPRRSVRFRRPCQTSCRY